MEREVDMMEKTNILIVEDDKAIADAVAYTLEQEEFRLIHAGSMSQALPYLGKKDIGLCPSLRCHLPCLYWNYESYILGTSYKSPSAIYVTSQGQCGCVAILDDIRAWVVSVC